MLILSIHYIVKRFTFMPPDPPKYKINKGEIFFVLKSETVPKKIHPRHFDVKFQKIYNDKKNNYLPILIISPIIDFKICIIYCQGNSGDLGISLFECHEIAIRCNSTIVTFEYPGYGICKDDIIIESEFFERIKLVYLYIINELGYKPEKIFLYGFSLGTGIVFDFACKKEYPVCGMILQSPFLSVVRTVYNIKKTKYFDLFNNCDKAKHLCTRTLFLHGNEDKVVPYIHGRILAKLIPEQYFYDFLTVDTANHNDLLKNNKDTAFNYINMFISECILDAKYKKHLKYNNYILKYNSSRKKNLTIEKSEDADLKDDEESKGVRLFENERTTANTYNNFKINGFYNKLNFNKDSDNFPNDDNDNNYNNYNETFNNQNSYMIENNNFQIVPKNRNIIPNLKKSIINKNNNKVKTGTQFNNNYYHVPLGTNSQIKKTNIFRPIYKRNDQVLSKNNMNDNNYFEICNSMVSINTSNAQINNNK